MNKSGCNFVDDDRTENDDGACDNLPAELCIAHQLPDAQRFNPGSPHNDEHLPTQSLPDARLFAPTCNEVPQRSQLEFIRTRSNHSECNLDDDDGTEHDHDACGDANSMIATMHATATTSAIALFVWSAMLHGVQCLPGLQGLHGCHLHDTKRPIPI